MQEIIRNIVELDPNTLNDVTLSTMGEDVLRSLPSSVLALYTQDVNENQFPKNDILKRAAEFILDDLDRYNMSTNHMKKAFLVDIRPLLQTYTQWFNDEMKRREDERKKQTQLINALEEKKERVKKYYEETGHKVYNQSKCEIDIDSPDWEDDDNMDFSDDDQSWDGNDNNQLQTEVKEKGNTIIENKEEEYSNSNQSQNDYDQLFDRMQKIIRSQDEELDNSATDYLPIIVAPVRQIFEKYYAYKQYYGFPTAEKLTNACRVIDDYAQKINENKNGQHLLTLCHRTVKSLNTWATKEKNEALNKGEKGNVWIVLDTYEKEYNELKNQVQPLTQEQINLSKNESTVNSLKGNIKRLKQSIDQLTFKGEGDDRDNLDIKETLFKHLKRQLSNKCEELLSQTPSVEQSSNISIVTTQKNASTIEASGKNQKLPKNDPTFAKLRLTFAKSNTQIKKMNRENDDSLQPPTHTTRVTISERAEVTTFNNSPGKNANEQLDQDSQCESSEEQSEIKLDNPISDNRREPLNSIHSSFLSNSIDDYQTSSCCLCFFAQPGPELGALKKLLADNEDKTFFSKSEIKGAISSVQNDNSNNLFGKSKQHRVDLLNNPDTHAADKTGVSEVIRAIARKLNHVDNLNNEEHQSDISNI